MLPTLCLAGLLTLLAPGADGAEATSKPAAPTVTVGPEKGWLIAIGGGRLTDEMLRLFVEKSGGRGAEVVYVPTAMGGNLEGREWGMADALRRAGLTVTVIHTPDPKVADTDEFVEPLTRAGGVWLSGGRQWRFTDAYLGTKTLDAMHGVLERGGVIAGSSAGATVQTSYMVRGAPEGNQVMMAKGHEEGFGFMRDTAIDQHVLARGRERDLIPVVEKHPELLGIGIDEGTAIVVHGDEMEVIGRSRVVIYDIAHIEDEATPPYYFLDAGDRFDLRQREVVKEDGS